MCEFVGVFLRRFLWENDDFGVPAPLCAGSGQGLETGVQKNHFGTKPLTLLGALFRAFRHFMALDFSFIFEVTSDSEF